MSFKALVTALSEQCHEIKQALSLFPYFDTWDNERIAECCRISSIVEYSPDQIILGKECLEPFKLIFYISLDLM